MSSQTHSLSVSASVQVDPLPALNLSPAANAPPSCKYATLGVRTDTPGIISPKQRQHPDCIIGGMRVSSKHFYTTNLSFTHRRSTTANQAVLLWKSTPVLRHLNIHRLWFQICLSTAAYLYGTLSRLHRLHPRQVAKAQEYLLSSSKHSIIRKTSLGP